MVSDYWGGFCIAAVLSSLFLGTVNVPCGSVWPEMGQGTPVSAGMAFSAGLRECMIHTHILPGLFCCLWNSFCQENAINAVLGKLFCPRCCKAWIFHLATSTPLPCMESWVNDNWLAVWAIAKCCCFLNLGILMSNIMASSSWWWWGWMRHLVLISFIKN